MKKSVHRHTHTQHIDIINVITHVRYILIVAYTISHTHSFGIHYSMFLLSIIARKGSSSFGKDKRSVEIRLFHEASRDSR